MQSATVEFAYMSRLTFPNWVDLSTPLDRNQAITLIIFAPIHAYADVRSWAHNMLNAKS